MLKKWLSVLLSVLMLITVFHLGLVTVQAGKPDPGPQVGDLIWFGSYPQTRVTNSILWEKLSDLDKTWKSYEYYSGTGELADGQAEPSAIMEFADFEYDGEKYRAVHVKDYRPVRTWDTASSEHSNHYSSGYRYPSVYYFKYEPIAWRVLDPDQGLLVTELALDAQPLNNTSYKYFAETWTDTGREYYANNYYVSTIREWLNYDFRLTAFSQSQQNNIRNNVTIDNSAYSTKYSQYDARNSNDQLFLLSYGEARTAAYGFTSDETRRTHGTDYALCQGLYNINTDTPWLLRTAGASSSSVCTVAFDGEANEYGNTDCTEYGIRVACRLKNIHNDTEVSDLLFSMSDTNEVSGVKLGDVDGNGEINSADARYALRRAVDLESYPAGSREFIACDVDKSGVVNAADARRILRAAVDLELLEDSVKQLFGVWQQQDSALSPMYYPTLTLNEDHTFHFVANLLEGTGNITGTFAIKENKIHCYVSERDFMGFAGDTLTELVFRVTGSELIYESDNLGWTEPGASFNK